MTQMAKMRPRTLHIAFGAYFALVFAFAGAFSMGLSAAWYGAELSRWVYAMYLIASAALLAGLGAAMAARTSSFDRRLADLERSAEREDWRKPEPETDAAGEKDHVDRDIDDLLDSLSEMETTTAEEAEEIEEASSAAEAVPSPVAGAEQVGARKPSENRKQLLRKRRSVRAFLAGPAVASVVFLGISGAMLPGVDGLLQTYHQLNTTLILWMAYGWAGLGAYAAAAFVASLRQR